MTVKTYKRLKRITLIQIICTALLIALKITNIYPLSWGWALFPIWGAVAVAILIVCISLILNMIK